MLQQYAVESVLSCQYQDNLAQKEEYITKLKKANKELKVNKVMGTVMNYMLFEALCQHTWLSRKDGYEIVNFVC